MYLLQKYCKNAQTIVMAANAVRSKPMQSDLDVVGEEKTTTTMPTTTQKTCQDTIDCSGYAASACTLFKSYMTDRCPQFCGFCSGKLSNNKLTKQLQHGLAENTTIT